MGGSEPVSPNDTWGSGGGGYKIGKKSVTHYLNGPNCTDDGSIPALTNTRCKCCQIHARIDSCAHSKRKKYIFNQKGSHQNYLQKWPNFLIFFFFHCFPLISEGRCILMVSFWCHNIGCRCSLMQGCCIFPFNLNRQVENISSQLQLQLVVFCHCPIPQPSHSSCQRVKIT